jgi:hypothetical protein
MDEKGDGVGYLIGTIAVRMRLLPLGPRKGDRLNDPGKLRKQRLVLENSPEGHERGVDVTYQFGDPGSGRIFTNPEAAILRVSGEQYTQTARERFNVVHMTRHKIYNLFRHVKFSTVRLERRSHCGLLCGFG